MRDASTVTSIFPRPQLGSRRCLFRRGASDSGCGVLLVVGSFSQLQLGVAAANVSWVAEGVWFQDTLCRNLLKYKGRSMYVLTFSLLQSQETTPPKSSLRKSNLTQYRSINRIATMSNISFNFRPTDTDLNRHKIFPPFLSLRVKSLCSEHRMERSTTPTWENLSVSSANLERASNS